MRQQIIEILIQLKPVMDGIAAYYLCQWLDRRWSR